MRIIIASLLLVSNFAIAAKVNLYDTRIVSGWKVLVDRDLRLKPEITKTGLANFEKALKSAELSLPEGFIKFSKAKGLKIFISPPNKVSNRTGMFFSPSNASSRGSGFEKIMDNSIVVIDESTLMKPEKIKYYLIHELAHYYHFNVVGYANTDIFWEYHYARHAPNFDKVSSYALNNHMEFFAELSAIYFTSDKGSNNLGVRLNKFVEKLWGTSEKRYNVIRTANPNLNVFPIIK